MKTQCAVENNYFDVRQKLLHYPIGEEIHVYHLIATAQKHGHQHSVTVKDVYGICFEQELEEILWFEDFQSKADKILVMKKQFQKAYSRTNPALPKFKDILSEYMVSPQNLFNTLNYNNGESENFLLIEYSAEDCECRFYKRKSSMQEKWMPHMEPYNHKTWMVTNQEYNLSALYEYLIQQKDVLIPNGIQEYHNIFDDEVTYALNFYVRVDNYEDAERDIFEDLPSSVIDISRFLL